VAKDYERRVQTSETLISLAAIRLMLNRIAPALTFDTASDPRTDEMTYKVKLKMKKGRRGPFPNKVACSIR
jgi:hypothetical protein